MELLSDLHRHIIEDVQRQNSTEKVIGVAVVAFDAPSLTNESERRPMLGSALGYTYINKDRQTGREVSGTPVVVVVDEFITKVDVEGGVIELTFSPAGVVPHEVGHLFGLGDEYCSNGVGNCPPPEGITYPNPAPQNDEEGDQFGSFIKQEQRAYDVKPIEEGFRPIINQAPPLSNGFWGYMGSTPDSTKWTGNREYEDLFGQLCIGCPEQKQLRINATLITQPRPVINLIGTISDSGEVQLKSQFTISTSTEIDPSVDGRYHLLFTDINGDALGSYGFDPFTEKMIWSGLEHFTEPLKPMPFVVSAPLPEGTKAVSLVQGETPLLVLEKSENPPVIHITTIDKLADERLEVNWAANDPDGNDLEYSVYYSPDGRLKTLVHAGISATRAVINLTGLDGVGPSELAFVQVVASDGFNSGEDQVSLNFDEITDRIALKQFNTRGPNIPGMCSRKNCIALKRHTLVAINPSNESDATVSLEIKVLSTPDPACTVNSALQGGSVNVASDILLRSGSSGRFDVELRFECPLPLDLNLASDFLLEATVRLYGAIDPVQGNNSSMKNQTVR